MNKLERLKAACRQLHKSDDLLPKDRSAYRVIAEYLEERRPGKALNLWTQLDTAARDWLTYKARDDVRLYDALTTWGVELLFDRPVPNQEPRRFTDDELGFLQLADSAVLAAVARGELDLNELARRALADRGLDEFGQWVGFAEAKARLQVKTSLLSGRVRI